MQRVLRFNEQLKHRESQTLCFILANTWHQHRRNHSVPSAFPLFCLGEASILVCWYASKYKVNAFLELSSDYGATANTMSIILKCFWCSRIQHLNHNCTIENSFGGRRDSRHSRSQDFCCEGALYFYLKT